MKRKTRKVLTAILVASVLAVTILVLSLNTLIDKNRQGIREEIEKALGRSVAFDNMRLDLWGGLGLAVKNLKISDDPRFAATPLIQAKEVTMQTRWLPLLRGKIEIKKFIMEAPEIQIIKNEAGDLNILAVAPSKKGGRGKRESKEGRVRSPLAFFVSAVQVSQGKINYVDRSSKEPVEVHMGNIDLSLSGFGVGETAGIRLAAKLLDSQGQNVLLEGQVGPVGSMKDWARVPLDLRTEVKSLSFAQLAQAVPMLKEQVPAYLDITGPLAFKAKLVGTLERPRIEDFTLTGAFFGSPTNNANVKGTLDFARNGSGGGPVVKGEVTVEPVSLDRLKKIPFVERILPPSFASRGPLSLRGKLEGSLRDLRVRAWINADKSEIRYGKWLEKPKGVRGEVAVGVVRKKDRLILEKSTLLLHNLKLQFSGLMEEKPERRLRLRIRTAAVEVSGWDKLLPLIAPYEIAGKMGFDLWIRKTFIPQGDNLDIRGVLNLEGLRARDRKNGRTVEGVTSKISFRGKEVEVESLRLRLGSSQLNLQATLQNLTNPTIRYTLRAAKLNLADLTRQPAHKGDWVKDLLSTGKFQARSGSPTMQARLSSGEGVVQKLAYKNLRGKVTWRDDSLDIKGAVFQSLGGVFKGDAHWERGDGKNPRFTVRPVIRGMDLKALLPHLAPSFSGRVEGLLDFNGKLSGSGGDWATVKRTLRGEGQAVVRGGSLKDFNLVEGVLSRVTGLPGIGNVIGTRVSPHYAAIFKRKDTPFERLEASFHLGDRRLITNNLILSTPDYTIQGKGWVGFDKGMKWSAVLAMSRRFTQELLEKHKNIRFLLDDRGRLGVPFELAGTLPNVRPMPDVKRLARTLQRGLLRKGLEKALGKKKSKKKRTGREWILKGLEQLLGQ